MAAGSNSTGELGVLQEHNKELSRAVSKAGSKKAAGWQQSSEEESDGADEADGEGDSTPTLLGEEGRCVGAGRNGFARPGGWGSLCAREAADAETNKISEPLPLFFERDENTWDTSAEEVPQTGSAVKLRHPPPRHIVAGPPVREPLAMPAVEPPDARPNSLLERTVTKKKEVSTSGYPLNVEGRLVYDSVQHNARRLLPRAGSQSRVGPDEPFYKLQSASDNTLVFDALFESANLYQAYQVGDFDYDLVLKNDTNTNGHTQWFYFAASNTRAGQKYTFRIINFYKRSSMYTTGLRPLLYSEVTAKLNDHGESVPDQSHKTLPAAYGWIRCGQDITYRRNDYQYSKSKRSQVYSYYTLKFSVDFEHSFDTIYLAHCYPYTYSDLQSYLGSLEASASTRRLCRRRLLCRTLAGNRCELLTITATGADIGKGSDEEYTTGAGSRRDPMMKSEGGLGQHSGQTSSENSQSQAEDPCGATGRTKKACIVLTARVHPGETNASWIMQGCIDYLTSDCEGARRLRAAYVIKIVPMLNPDGVIVGNYRTGLAGCDLNRKRMLETMRDERGVSILVDIHGHSVKNNSFMYGCDAEHWNGGQNHPSRAPPRPFHSRIFPAQMAQTCPSFNLMDCRFHVRRRKETTGRVVAWRQFTPYSYTLEASFGGADADHFPASTHFGIDDFVKIGRDLCIALDEHLCRDVAGKEAARLALLEQVENLVLSAGGDDSDDGTAEMRRMGSLNESSNAGTGPSSDDDSDDDTVDTVVLPNKLVPRVSAQAKKKDKTAKRTDNRAGAADKVQTREKTRQTLTAARQLDADDQAEKRDADSVLTPPSRAVRLSCREHASSSPRPKSSKPDARCREPSPLCHCPSCQVFDNFIAPVMLALSHQNTEGPVQGAQSQTGEGGMASALEGEQGGNDETGSQSEAASPCISEPTCQHV